MTDEQRRAIEFLIKDAEGMAWRAFATYNRKTKRYDFTEDMWKEGRPEQLRAVQVARDMIASR